LHSAQILPLILSLTPNSLRWISRGSIWTTISGPMFRTISVSQVSDHSRPELWIHSWCCVSGNVSITTSPYGGPTDIKDPPWNRLPLLVKTGECNRNDISGINAGQLSNFYTQFCDSIADENASLTKVILTAMPSPHQTRTNTGVHLLETR
jgi:hypothetical protein